MHHTTLYQPKFWESIPNYDSLKAVDDSISDSKEKLNNLARLYNAYLCNDPGQALKYDLGLEDCNHGNCSVQFKKKS